MHNEMTNNRHCIPNTKPTIPSYTVPNVCFLEVGTNKKVERLDFSFWVLVKP